MDFMERVKSRKFILIVVYCLILLLNDVLDLQITKEVLDQLLIPVLGYVGVEGIRDIVQSTSENG